MKKQVKRKRGIRVETVVILMLNAFTLGILIEKIAMCGFSWMSTTGLLG